MRLTAFEAQVLTQLMRDPEPVVARPTPACVASARPAIRVRWNRCRLRPRPGHGRGRLRALLRGERLDESTPGRGLGLSIVRELARPYGGELRLARSSLGGLSAQLRLPLR